MINSIHVNCLNEVMSCKASVTKPMVGLAATMFVGSDRYAMVVTDVLSDKKIMATRMYDEDYKTLNEKDAIQILDSSVMGKYTYLTEDRKHILPIGIVYSLRKNHRWLKEGQGLWETGSIHLGHAENYLDPCF